MQTQNFFSSLDKAARQGSSGSSQPSSGGGGGGGSGGSGGSSSAGASQSAGKKKKSNTSGSNTNAATKATESKAAKKKQPQQQPPSKAASKSQPQQQQSSGKKKKKNKSGASSNNSNAFEEEWETIPEHLLKEWAREAEELERRQKLEEEQKKKELEAGGSTTTTTTTTATTTTTTSTSSSSSSASLEELLSSGVLTKAQYKNIKKREKKRRAKQANQEVATTTTAPGETISKSGSKDKKKGDKTEAQPTGENNPFSSLDKFEQKSQRVSEKIERKADPISTTIAAPTISTPKGANSNGGGKKNQKEEVASGVIGGNASITAPTISTAKTKDDGLQIPTIVYQPDKDKGLFALSEGIIPIDDSLDLPDIMSQHLGITDDTIESSLMDNTTAFENASRQQSRLLRLLRQSSDDEPEELIDNGFGSSVTSATSMIDQGLYNNSSVGWTANTSLLTQNHFSPAATLFGGVGVDVGLGGFGLEAASSGQVSSFGFNHFGALNGNGALGAAHSNLSNGAGGFLNHHEDEERANRARLMEALNGDEFDPNGKHKYVPPHKRSSPSHPPSSSTYKPPRIVQPPPGFLPLFQPQ